MNGDDFDLYNTPRGLKPITSPIKRGILNLLKDSPRTQREVMASIGRAQSTTARHLLELEAASLVRSSVDPADSRRKVYHLTGRLAATGGGPTNAFSSYFTQTVRNGLANDAPLMERINHGLRYVTQSWGLSLDSMLREVGHDIGIQMAESLDSSAELDAVIESLATLWEDNKMGLIEKHQDNPLVLRIDGNYDCTGVPDVGKPLCALDEGIMEGVLSNSIGGDWKVREFACHGTGHDHCLFKVEPPW
ncbi:MAG: hypothetical protein CL960_01290 [Euryarchaeota archaeon]|jgi:hypothetical protein|nr:hypothetical protein [Euryarchaeota archaeon]MDP6363526.1 MarR family transcriptional regulator [Candidatus Poseidoniia archaeon]MDP6658556.1 MarR family transcriptional regulator [Candidatus Poseidoniia archaeon]MDP6846879.1 MarR family transcriptional regulator [Candidatus Poseidoniia archaeon]MDP7007087.1 MarR family transcriptional regulator [Candidatus Poseidoniia archaeon]